MSQTSKLSEKLKLLFSTFTQALGLTIRNPFAYVLFTLYMVIFYFGTYYYLKHNYILSTLLFVVFSFCAGSVFALTGEIVKKGKFTFGDFLHSFKKYYIRTVVVLVFWFAIYYIANTFLVTPISSVIKEDYKVYFTYLVIVPVKLFIFFVFNVLPEAIYYSEENVESIFISSIKFMEKHWAIWIVPNIVIMFLLNLFDHRISIEPTLGHLYPQGIIAKVQDIAFLLGMIIFTVALIFRGLLYKKLITSSNIK